MQLVSYNRKLIQTDVAETRDYDKFTNFLTFFILYYTFVTMKAYVRFIPVFLMLFFFVQVGAPPTSDNEKKIETRSDPGSAGDPDQAKEKEQNKDVDKQDTADKDSKEESLENKEQTGVPSPPSTKLPVSPSPTAADNNCTGTNNTKECEEEGVKPSLKQMLTSMVTENKGMLTRTLYVLIGVTLIVVVYYVMRAIR